MSDNDLESMVDKAKQELEDRLIKCPVEMERRWFLKNKKTGTYYDLDTKPGTYFGFNDNQYKKYMMNNPEDYEAVLLLLPCDGVYKYPEPVVPASLANTETPAVTDPPKRVTRSRKV